MVSDKHIIQAQKFAYDTKRNFGGDNNNPLVTCSALGCDTITSRLMTDANGYCPQCYDQNFTRLTFYKKFPCKCGNHELEILPDGQLRHACPTGKQQPKYNGIPLEPLQPEGERGEQEEREESITLQELRELKKQFVRKFYPRSLIMKC